MKITVSRKFLIGLTALLVLGWFIGIKLNVSTRSTNEVHGDSNEYDNKKLVDVIFPQKSVKVIEQTKAETNTDQDTRNLVIFPQKTANIINHTKVETNTDRNPMNLERRLKNETEINLDTSNLLTDIPVTEIIENEQLFRFKRRVSERGLSELKSLFKTCIKQLDSANITYMAFSGTLLGIYRNHDMIDWDDKISILVDDEVKADVIKALNRTSHVVKEVLLKTRSKLQFTHNDVVYPFVDIFFAEKKSNNDFQLEINDNFVIRGRYLYPVVKRPFHDLQVSTPCNISGILEDLYGNLTFCQSPTSDNMANPKIPFEEVVVKNCDLLKPFSHFVKRSVIKNSTHTTYYEDLMLGKKVVHNVVYSTPVKCSDSFSVQENNMIVSKV